MSDQTHQLLLETWNSRSIQNAHESVHLVWEQFIDSWIQTKFSLQQYDLNFVIDAIQSKIIYLTGNNCKWLKCLIFTRKKKFILITELTISLSHKCINYDLIKYILC